MDTKIDLSEYQEIDALVQRLHRRRKTVDVSGLELHGNTKAFLQQMMDVERSDRELNRAKKPAIGKIKMLPLVTAQLSNRNVHHQLLDALVLQRVRDWLRPLPDGSLPNSQLRAELYRLLDLLPIDSDHLQESEGLGIELMRLWRSPKETAENRRFLHRLIEKWIRAIFKNTADMAIHKEKANFDPNRPLDNEMFSQRGSRKRKTEEADLDEIEGGNEKLVKSVHKRIEDKFYAMDKNNKGRRNIN